MASRFCESLGIIKGLREETLYSTQNECDFIERYVEASSFHLDEDLMGDRAQFAQLFPFMPNPLRSGFYSDLYSSFLFVFEIEKTLDNIEHHGMNLENIESLNSLCGLLCVASTDAMISIDEEFLFSKKYSLAQDIYVMAKNMYDSMLFAHTIRGVEMSPDQVVHVTSYDEIENRLCVKYIRNGIEVLKLFHLLAVLQVSPLYSDGGHLVAKRLIKELREILFDKRILKLVVDFDINGLNPKPHKSTRLKIYFVMSNSDRYCIRLDFSHPGEECIHLNLNEPGHKQSTGFPLEGKNYEELISICGDENVFDKLFYYRDDMYWFRSNYAKTIKSLKKDDEKLANSLEQFHHNRAHLVLFSSDDDNTKAVVEFSEAFAEAMGCYENTCIYGQTDSDDDEFYQYTLFQDYIFDTIIKVRSYELQIRIGDFVVQKEMGELEAELKSMFRRYIEEKMPQDEELMLYADTEEDFHGFLLKCIDRLDSLGV